jgi:hypothetical protein
VYFQIIAGNEKLPTNCSESDINRHLTCSRLNDTCVEESAFQSCGHHVGRAQMILGLLYKTKKKRALAVQHLTEAKRIIRSQFRQMPMLARIDAALAELG